MSHTRLAADKWKYLIEIKMSYKENHCSCQCVALPSVTQTLDELDFERGIWYFAMHGDTEKLREKLNKGTNPSECDKSGYTALHYAARSGREAACKFLLERGAQVNVQTHGGATPLHRASLQGHLSIVNLLIKYGANPLISDSDGKTALHKAVEGKHSDVAQILVKLNPTLKDIGDKKGNTPLFYVAPGCTELKTILQN